jgi:hypothetical protein
MVCKYFGRGGCHEDTVERNNISIPYGRVYGITRKSSTGLKGFCAFYDTMVIPFLTNQKPALITPRATTAAIDASPAANSNCFQETCGSSNCILLLFYSSFDRSLLYSLKDINVF